MGLTKLEALQKLRAIGRGSRGVRTLFEDGIFCTYRGRYEQNTDDVAALVVAAGGEVFSKRKIGKTVDGSPSWRLSFAMGTIADDSYIRGTITLAERREWLGEAA